MIEPVLTEIQQRMKHMGWKGDPRGGFDHKEDARGNIIARRGDAVWMDDVDQATEMVSFAQAMAELDRRDQARRANESP